MGTPSSLPSLDRLDHIELTLLLNSFAGGENTIGEDAALKNNEARNIENWDAISLGGMIRSKGFNEVADAPAAIEADVFTGSGLNDATAGGTYTGTATATYTVIIDHTGTPDSFKWKKNSGAFTEDVAITGAAQVIADGVTITFAATTGHTATDQWVITATVYTSYLDLLAHHKETSGTKLYAVVEGDLLYKDAATLLQADISAFTSGVLCHAVSAGDALWITNATDGLKRKVIAGALAAPADVPTACARIYTHKFRLVAEGSGKVVQGSRAGTGNWNETDTWDKTNDAWSITMPDTTYGCAPEFPSGNELLVFSKYRAYALYNFPSVAHRPISNSVGCVAPYSIAIGAEGVFFLSDYPKLGVFLFNGVDWVELTPNHDFVNDIDITKRIFGIYRNQKYFIFYNETGSGVTYPNRCKVYETLFGRWMSRPVNVALADNFGYPALLKYDNNELYVGSSRKDKVYELETTDNSDEALDTVATYTTKDFSSRDFTINGAQFPLDEVRIKLIKAVVTYYGTTGNITLKWTADRGRYTGSQTITMTTTGGTNLNTDFTVNTSSVIVQSTIDKTVVFTFNNSAVGRRFSFEINNSSTGTRPKIKSIKLYALALEEA